MSALLNSVRADLLDRRMRLLLALVVVALVAALAYALLGGGGGATAPVLPETGASSTGAGPSGIAVTAANSNHAVAEVSGASEQHDGSARNPFAPLPGSSASPSASPSPSSSASASHPASKSGAQAPAPSSGAEPSITPSTSGAGTTTGGAAPAAPKKKAPAKAKTPYVVDALFGPIIAGTPPQNAQLTPYSDLALKQKLPSRQDQLLSFSGITSSGKRATFKLLSEVILRGQATCLPQPTQCEAIALGPGQSEELERLHVGAAPEVFAVEVVSITARSGRAARAKAARARARRAHEARARRGGPSAPAAHAR